MVSIREHLSISRDMRYNKHLGFGGINLHISNRKAVSTLTLIVLMLCSAVFGAFVSYLWVMSSYFNMPEDTTLLIVEDVVFPVFDARYFSVTILNPSNSISDVNITAIRLGVVGKNEVYNVTKAGPALPFPLKIGTKQTFNCNWNWGNFAGETLRIEPVAANASTKSYSYVTPRVKLKLTPKFDPSQSIEYFNLTVENYASIINLTISKIIVLDDSMTPMNITPSLPYVLSPDQTEIFRCDWNWENYRGENVTITVETSEGYESVYTTNELPGAALYIDEVKFDYTDTKYFNLTISSSEYSTATAMINRVNLTLTNETTIILDTIPPLDIIPIPIPPNESLTIRCIWNWNTHRNETVTVRVYTNQGFIVPSKIVITPPATVWNITDVKFDLDDIEHFLVNVTNTPCSLQSINVTQIRFNENVTEITPSSWRISAGEERLFGCAFNWTSFKGESVVIMVCTADELNISRSITLPSVELKIINASFETSEGSRYFNVTIENVKESLLDVTVARIVVSLENETVYESKGVGILIEVGKNLTLTFSLNWSSYENEDVTISVYTEEGFEATARFIAKE
jgi:hypothetical protein